MQDRELIRMAAFKLQETAKRLEQLAQNVTSAEAGTEMRNIAAALVEHERSLWKLAEEPPQLSASPRRVA